MCWKNEYHIQNYKTTCLKILIVKTKINISAIFSNKNDYFCKKIKEIHFAIEIHCLIVMNRNFEFKL